MYDSDLGDTEWRLIAHHFQPQDNRGAASTHAKRNIVDVRRVAEGQRALVAARIADLAAMQDTLDGLIDRCRNAHPPGHCPLIETLAHRDRNNPPNPLTRYLGTALKLSSVGS